MKYLLSSFLVVLAASCTGSGGTETGNPATLERFSSSACKSQAQAPAPQALVLDSDAEGLQCVEWSRDAAGVLTLRLLNFPEACGDDYTGDAKVAEDGALELSLYKQSCQVNRCGTCLFDFEAELRGLPVDQPLPLRIGSAICKTEATTWDDTFSLPQGEQDYGVRCRYVRQNALEQYGSARGSCGGRNMPCGDCGGLDKQSCGDGLTCSAVADGDSRCLASCATDDDCSGGLTACRDGLCQSSFDW